VSCHSLERLQLIQNEAILMFLSQEEKSRIELVVQGETNRILILSFSFFFFSSFPSFFFLGFCFFVVFSENWFKDN
jgi:hypothetical protein